VAAEIYRDPDLEWLDHVPPVGLVVAPTLLKELGLLPLRQTPIDTGQVAEIIGSELSKPALTDPWAFVEQVLGWETRHVAGAPGGPSIPDELLVALPEHGTTLRPTWAVAELGDGDRSWQLLVRIEAPGVDPDARNALDGWEATPHQRFERLLRDTGVFAGLLISERDERKDGEVRYYPEFRLIYAPRGETSGHQSFPIRPMAMVAGRPMLGGLKLLLDRFRLFSDADDRRLPALLKHSRDSQAVVSTALAEQVLGALHELLRGLDGAEPTIVRELAANSPDHLYEGLLTVLMRLVFVLYAEDRDLLPSRSDARAREIYETSYSVRGLYAKLTEDATLNPDTMDERRGGWGGLLALFRLIHKGHQTGFVQARGGKLFDPDEFSFLEGRASKDDPARILAVSDGCLLRIFEGLMTLKLRGAERERLSYRTLDVEQIGSVYETVMGFTVEAAKSRVLAIKAGKNNKTPVFVALDDLLEKKGKDRIKELKENVGRTLTAAQVKPVEDAKNVEDLVAALDGMVDERGSPKKRVAASGTPILQPTGERRRTGSHYTPRSLTAPIVRYALEPAFERLGTDATPDQLLDLKVCDPAMGSGAFLVEACRALGERLVAAWARWPQTRPTIPADEDEELHARRLVAQRCLYGVDKNPRAVDLARLSLWLATLARDHEFTFLDHALKCGDSLVGLRTSHIGRLAWRDGQSDFSPFDGLLRERITEAVSARAEIQQAPDDLERLIQEQRHRHIESRLLVIRQLGDAIVASFFQADKEKQRELARRRLGVLASGLAANYWPKFAAMASEIRGGDNPIIPFHWELEFPEVFARENGGFDAITGNPPFAGKNTLINGNAENYLPWLQTLHEDAHGNSDLVAHFFRRAFGLLRMGGVFGLIATNTIGQGDTRASGLTKIIAVGGAILRATRRLKWPGEAAVVVSVVHIVKGPAALPMLDMRPVRRISAYLVEGDLDTSPVALAANSGKAFQGSIVLGMGFTFDDVAAAKGEAESLETMRKLIAKDPRNSERIFPYIGGEEVNNSPTHAHHRYVIDFFDRPLRRDPKLQSWFLNEGSEACEKRRREWLRDGTVPTDYPGEVAEDWPDLIEIVRRRVKPERDPQKRDALRDRWWQYAEKRPGLYNAIAALSHVQAVSRVSPQWATVQMRSDAVYADSTVVFALPGLAAFAALQSRSHEIWARFFSSSMKDDLRYAPSDCFRTFPFPVGFDTEPALEAAGESYHAFRAQLMIDRNEGLTKIYNRFHARGESAAAIARLRALHHEMDLAVLRAYARCASSKHEARGWDDLADRAAPAFIEQEADEGKTPKTRFDWPSDFKDDVLARLLALNSQCAAAERAAGVTAVLEDDGPADKEQDE
jgi:hypothetical protein